VNPSMGLSSASMPQKVLASTLELTLADNAQLL